MGDERKEQMLRMWLGGQSYAEIGRHFGISRQRVTELLSPLNATRKYVVDRSEGSQDDSRKGVKSLLDKIVLKVRDLFRKEGKNGNSN